MRKDLPNTFIKYCFDVLCTLTISAERADYTVTLVHIQTNIICTYLWEILLFHIDMLSNMSCISCIRVRTYLYTIYIRYTCMSLQVKWSLCVSVTEICLYKHDMHRTPTSSTICIYAVLHEPMYVYFFRFKMGNIFNASFHCVSEVWWCYHILLDSTRLVYYLTSINTLTHGVIRYNLNFIRRIHARRTLIHAFLATFFFFQFHGDRPSLIFHNMNNTSNVHTFCTLTL